MFYAEVNEEPIGFYDHVETALARGRELGAKVFREDGTLLSHPVAPTRKRFVLRSLRTA